MEGIEELRLSYTPTGFSVTLTFNEALIQYLGVLQILLDEDIWDTPADLERFERDLCEVLVNAL